jgi:hypothetical protein
MWNLNNIGIALVARLISRASLIAKLPSFETVDESGNPKTAYSIRPEGTGDEMYPAINYQISDVPSDENRRVHEVTIYLYLDGRDSSGVSGYNDIHDIEAELYEELNRDEQDDDPVAFLDLSAYGYIVRYQKVKQLGIPAFKTNEKTVEEQSLPPSWRKALILNLVVLDNS